MSVCVRFITFCVSRRRRKMYCGHARLCVCVSVRGRTPTLLHGPGCNLGAWKRLPPGCALLGRFAISAPVALLWQHNANHSLRGVRVRYSDQQVTEAFSTLRAVYGKWAWLARQ